MFAVHTLKFKQRGLSIHREICPKSAVGMAKSVDPDHTAPNQTVPLGAV